MSTLRLPAIFSDHLVLQSDQQNPIWGWAAAGGEVSIRWQGGVEVARVDSSGQWKTHLSAATAGGPYTIELSSGGEKLTLGDVLVGEVWLCSGQSNMEWSVRLSLNAEKEIDAAQFPSIRLLKIPQVPLAEPADDVKASWTVCSPETVRDFSAVAYFFGRDLHRTRNVPIGLIDSSWGGTNAETWVEWSHLENEPAFDDFMKPYLKELNGPTVPTARDVDTLERWTKVERWKDPGNRGYFLDWAEPRFDDSGWKSYQVPGMWQNQGMLHNGAVWFRRQVEVPKEWAGRDLMVSPGALDDYDEAYFNGVPIGSTGNETPNWWVTPRYYKIPADLVKPGESNTLAVRIFDDFDQGGFVEGTRMALYPADSKPEEGVAIDGEWKCRVEYAFDSTIPPRVQKLKAGGGPNMYNSPANTYNGMIAPLVPYGLKGVIWYQGESNAERAEQYKLIFHRLIESWRKHFENPDLGFFFVLLASFRMQQTHPVEAGWGEIREAQLSVLNMPLTGYASAIDVGEANDAHPRDKQSVGHRLALSARAILYGEKVDYQGPIFEQAKPEGARVRLLFKNAAGLKTRDGGPLVGFAVRGSGNGEGWVWAEAKINGEEVILAHPNGVPIGYIRYAWATNPIGNLTNAAGLPAEPFRTDK